MVDENNVYFTLADGRVGECSLQGCNKQATFLYTGPPNAGGIVLAQGRFVWAILGVPGALYSCPFGPCPAGPSVFASAPSGLSFVTANASDVFWSELPHTVFRCPAQGCTTPQAVFVGTGPSLGGVVVNGDSIFFTEQAGDKVYRCPLASGCGADGGMSNLVVLATNQSNPGAIGVNSTAVFWSDSAGRIMKCPLTGCGGTPAQIGVGSPAASLVVDEQFVYWTAQIGLVEKCSVTGCGATPTTVATNQDGAAGIAQDAKAIYWAAGAAGRVMRAGK